MAKKTFLKGLKIRTIYPFYIKNVNEKFFTELSNNSNTVFVKKFLPKIEEEFDKEDIEALKIIENLRKPEKILRMINSSLLRIVSLTGSKTAELFSRVGTDELKQPLYIKTKSNFSDLEIIGDVHEDRRFSYAINVDENSYLFEFVEQIQLGFYLDHETNRISGGFSLNSGNSTAAQEFEEAVEKVYILKLINKFWKSQLYPMTLENILYLISDINNVENDNELVDIIDADQITIQELKHNWIRFIDKKFIKFKKMNAAERKEFENKSFYSILILSLIMLYILQEINNYFTSEKPELILSLLSKPTVLKDNGDQNYEGDFKALSLFLKEAQTRKTDLSNKAINKVKDANDLINLLSKFNISDQKNVFLGEFISTFEIIPEQKVKILDKDNFLEDWKFKTFFLMLIFPEIYSLSINNPHLIEYKHLWNSINSNQDINISSAILEDIDEAICEMNYDFASFITSETILILKNNDPLYLEREGEKTLVVRDENRRLYNNYFWAEIYLQSKISEKNSIESAMSKISQIKQKQKTLVFKNAIQNLEDLQFDWYDHFYGLPQIKKIVKKLDERNDFKNSLEILSTKIQNEDEITKKDGERNWIILAFIIALLNSLIDFIACVFSILPNLAVTEVGHSYVYAFVGVATFIASIMFGILVVTATKLFKFKKKIKNLQRNKTYQNF